MTENNTINDSFHNLCIVNDCLGPVNESVFQDLIINQADRFATDKCGNIRAIDGKRVTGGDLVYRLEDSINA